MPDRAPTADFLGGGGAGLADELVFPSEEERYGLSNAGGVGVPGKVLTDEPTPEQ